MSSLENIFIKEFKRNMRSGGINKNIFEVPLPSEVKDWEVSGTELFIVNGLSSESCGLYYGLNGNVVKKLPKNMVASRRKTDIVTRDFARDKNGRYIYEDVKIPNGSIVVVSEQNLDLPYKYESPEDGFGYIDFVTDGSNVEYLYYIPKKYVYQTHQTALALSVKNMKNFSGMGYHSWKYGLIFLHIIPYKPTAQYVGTKILKTDLSVNYSKEVKNIVDYWIESGIIPSISLCETELEGNLALKETQRGYDTYTPFEEISLGDREIYGSKEEDSNE